MDKMKCLKHGPKETVEHLSSAVGGVMNASAPGELPRNEKQVTNLRQQAKLKGHTCGPSGEVDDLFVVMQRAYSEDPGSKFIRSIRAAPDPAIVLAEDHQIADLVRFCTSSTEFGILTVDPTFSLGHFDVTPITYRHLLLSTKRNENTPVFLGPVLIHYRKTFATYLFFASSLVGLSSQLEGIRAFGTDGEKALSDAFTHEFGFSQRLTCFIHVRKNIKDKLSECSIPTLLSQQILDDIFGKRIGSTFVEGIVDASDDSDFQSKLENCLRSWRSFEVTSTCNLQKFIDYLVDSKASVIRDTMLRPIRVECGLGCPPEIFTTNASESVNAILKRKLDYKQSELPEFIDKVKEVITEQQREVERAVISRGKYHFREQYKHLEISEMKWFSMNSEQRKKHLHQLQHEQVFDSFNTSSLASKSISQESTPQIPPLSVSVESASEQVNIPLNCLEGVWAKAVELINTSNAIVPAPGQDPEVRMVLSYSGKVPHMVTPNKGGEFCCDSNCPNWKAMGICSHTVAVAEVNKKLQRFLSSRKRKKGVNYTKLLTTSMPRGRGRKGGVTPRVRKPSQPITTRIERSTASDTSFENASPPTVTCHAHEGGSVFMPGFGSPHFNMVQSPVQQSPMNFYGPYAAHPMYPPYHQGAQHEAGNPFQTPSPYQSYYQPSVPFTLSFISGNISVCIGCKNKYPKSPKRHKTYASGTKNGDSSLLIQALHSPNLETYTTTVEKGAFGCVAHTLLPMIFNFLPR